MIALLRKEIDKIDKEIIELLVQRFALSEKIGKEKKKIEKAVQDSRREEEIFSRIATLAPGRQKEISDVYQRLFEISRHLQG